MTRITIPEEAAHIIDTFENSGCEAFVVGGCVRDCLLGKAPVDWDICTPSLPERTIEIFKGRHIIETGLKHGTITLMLNHKPFEITTYRIDGTYSDNRRPDSVEFVNDLKEDLARRDFTINAMAYSPKCGLIDFFEGEADLQNKTIRCVGDADKRFQEDALRVMRALRFASNLCFTIAKDTSDAAYRNKGLLHKISAERLATELSKLITGANACATLSDYAPVLVEIIPEIKDMIGFNQNTPYHFLDVWEHTLARMGEAPADVTLRLTMLLHDVAKPGCYSEVDGTGHFYGHPQVSSDIAKKTLRRLKYDNNTIETVTQLILYHDTGIEPEMKQVKRWLNRIGEQRLRQLVEVKKADAMAQSEKYRRVKLDALRDIVSLIDEIIEKRQCFSLKDMAVDGKDLIASGIPEGAEIGKILNRLLDMILDEQIGNEKTALLEAAQQITRS
ncbi:MAG: HD domain-containing protein [Oscillospiraceae bacterium]|jgi:tRNA nucleotidyltransferase (CCA-adding enzyme)|nr:HD domain-containing protein [Oscillospiraceae bacterium]